MISQIKLIEKNKTLKISDDGKELKFSTSKGDAWTCGGIDRLAFKQWIDRNVETYDEVGCEGTI